MALLLKTSKSGRLLKLIRLLSTLKQYASIYKKFLDPRAVSTVTNDGFTSSWKIEIDGSVYFYAVISPLEKVVLRAGEISNALKSGEGGIQPEYDVLNYGVETESSIKLVIYSTRPCP